MLDKKEYKKTDSIIASSNNNSRRGSVNALKRNSIKKSQRRDSQLFNDPKKTRDSLRRFSLLASGFNPDIQDKLSEKPEESYDSNDSEESQKNDQNDKESKLQEKSKPIQKEKETPKPKPAPKPMLRQRRSLDPQETAIKVKKIL